MMRTAILTLILAAAAPLATAENWAVGVGTGAFVFGDFAESERTIGNPEQVTKIRSSLSAATQPGVRIDVERFFNRRFSARAEATFVRTKLSVKTETASSDAEGVSLDIGHLNVTTIAIPLVYRINGGSLQFQLFAGPAYAIYDMDRDQSTGEVPLFQGSRGEFGVLGGGGLEWWFGENWAIRGTVSDIYTGSPLKESDFERAPPPNLEIDDMHNIHTLVGAVYRF